LVEEKRFCCVAVSLQQNGNEHGQFVTGTVNPDLRIGHLCRNTICRIVEHLLQHDPVDRFINDSCEPCNNNGNSINQHLP
jgi:hypothetical protein